MRMGRIGPGVLLGVLLALPAMCAATTFNGYSYDQLEHRNDLNGTGQTFTATNVRLSDASFLLCERDPTRPWWSQARLQVRAGPPGNFDGTSGNILFESPIIDFDALPPVGTAFNGDDLYELKLSEHGMTTELALSVGGLYSVVIVDPGTTGWMHFAGESPGTYAGGNRVDHNRAYANEFWSISEESDLAFQVTMTAPEPSSGIIVIGGVWVTMMRRAKRTSSIL